MARGSFARTIPWSPPVRDSEVAEAFRVVGLSIKDMLPSIFDNTTDHPPTFMAKWLFTTLGNPLLLPLCVYAVKKSCLAQNRLFKFGDVVSALRGKILQPVFSNIFIPWLGCTYLFSGAVFTPIPSQSCWAMSSWHTITLLISLPVYVVFMLAYYSFVVGDLKTILNSLFEEQESSDTLNITGWIGKSFVCEHMCDVATCVKKQNGGNARPVWVWSNCHPRGCS